MAGTTETRADSTDARDFTGQAQRLHALIQVEGGFTLRRREGVPVDSGISVAAHPAGTLSFDRSQWCDQRVAAWLTDVENRPGFLGTHIGGWQDPESGRIHLDIVVIMPGFLRWAARAAGRFFGQHCIYDLGRKETLLL
jgi:hypothetical protein